MENNNTTFSNATEIKDEDVDYNIARLIAGNNITETSLLQARQMRIKAQKSE